jgi:hypothetical protein
MAREIEVLRIAHVTKTKALLKFNHIFGSVFCYLSNQLLHVSEPVDVNQCIIKLVQRPVLDNYIEETLINIREKDEKLAIYRYRLQRRMDYFCSSAPGEK